jgi:hypothetical protein
VTTPYCLRHPLKRGGIWGAPLVDDLITHEADQARILSPTPWRPDRPSLPSPDHLWVSATSHILDGSNFVMIYIRGSVN